MRQLLAIGLLGLLSAPVLAQSTKVGPGVQIKPSASAPTTGLNTGNALLWCDSADSNKLKYRNPAGSTVTLDGTGGGGGGGTVTDVTCGTGLSGGTFTGSGTCSTASQVPYASGTPAKGDIYAYTGSAWTRLAAGTNGECLQAASGETSGLDWGACGTSGVTSVATDATLTASTEPIVATGTLSINLGNANTWTSSQNVASVALSDGANISTNAALGNTFTVTINGNRTLDNPTNLVGGGTYQWEITQGSGGSHTLSYGSTFAWLSGSAPILSTVAADVDLISCVYSSATSKLRCAHAGPSSGGGGGGGTVTSVTCGTGLSGGTFTTSGTCAIDGTVVTESSSDVLTNKTLTAPVINGLTSSGSTAINFSGNSGTFSTPTGASTFGGSSNSFVAAIADAIASIGTSQTAGGITASNSTAASAGAQQFAPPIRNCGNGWKTDATAASQEVCWETQVRPVQGTSAPTSEYVFWRNVNGGAYTEADKIRNDNGLQFPGNAVIYANAGADYLFMTSASMIFDQAGTGSYTWAATSYSGTDGVYTLGTASARWNGTFTEYTDTRMGSQLTAAATITPVYGFHHVTGATTIDTIAVTNFAGNPTLTLVADGGTITWSASGNILSAGTITQDKAQMFIYDLAATKWVPHQ